MTKGRLEAFTDAVIAIILTIMVLELRAPHGTNLKDLEPLLPTFACYAISFVFLGIYWNNHHHMFQHVRRVSGGVLWANMHLLFWLSMVPFGTQWLGENTFSCGPVMLYGFVLFMCGCAYFILTRVLLRVEGPESSYAKHLGGDFKGRISVLIYAVAIGLANIAPAVSCGLYVLVAAIWLVPDRRFEHHE